MELVSVLGSSQRCPYSDIGGSSPVGETWCPSEDQAESWDLSKERIYRGAVAGHPFPGLGLQPDFRSLVWPLVYENDSNVDLNAWYSFPPLELDPLKGHSPLRHFSVKCKHAGLVVLTHSFGSKIYPPIGLPESADPPELELNEKIFDNFRTDPYKQQTPLVIVVIPTISTLPQTDRIRHYLFSSRASQEDPNVHVLLLAPRVCIDDNDETECTDADFHRYWAEVLDPNNPSYVEYVARDFFSTIINGGLPKRVL
jgi:hypothetical protein